MFRIKSTIPKTNLYNQLNNLRGDIGVGVFGQMDWDLYHYGWEMICDEVYSATLRSIDQICISDIIEQI